MFSKLIVCAIVGLASLVAASDPTTPQRLRAKSNSTSLAYNGFYFGTYHQGAGLADATLLANASEALAGAFLNATANVTTSAYYLDFNTSISTGGSSVEYYHAQITGTGGYESMKLMTVNLAEAPSEGFSFDSQGRLAYQNSTDFAACEWTHLVRCLHRSLLIVAWISNCVLEVPFLRKYCTLAVWMRRYRVDQGRPILLNIQSRAQKQNRCFSHLDASH
jgi:hypothetical protein